MGPMDIKDILDTIPHRYPMLLLDKVLTLEPTDKIVALKNVSANEHFFQGHFPTNPVMPGVLVVEALAQAMAVLAFKTLEHSGKVLAKDAIFYFAGIDGVRFKRPVYPGDQLHLEVQLLKQKSGIWKAHGEATIEGSLVCKASLLAYSQG